jgi:hypothetical protein
MTRMRPLLLGISILSLASCATEKKPLTGFANPPPGSIVLDNLADGRGIVNMWPMFDLPVGSQIFRPRLGGQDAVMVSHPDEFYDYQRIYLQGWTAGSNTWLSGIPPGTYSVELVDSAGQSWGQSAPLSIPAAADPFSFTPGVQRPTVVFAHFESHVTSWTIDPALVDGDVTTDEITVSNLVTEDVVVERCQVVSGSPTSCTPVGTAAPGADLHTVEVQAGTSDRDHQALLIHLASDTSQSYQRDLVAGPTNFGSTCQIERIIFHGQRSQGFSDPSRSGSVAMSSCFGYQNGAM